MFDKLIEKLPIVSCQEATKLMSLSQERRLALRETIDLKLHLCVCVFCVRFLKQIQGLRKTLRAYRAKLVLTSSLAEQSLTDQGKAHIKQFLKTHSLKNKN